jgi:uncharacterized protein YprB with RNaseH-like and TPR domain
MGLMVLDIEVETAVTNWNEARKGANGVSVVCLYDEEEDNYFFYDSQCFEVMVAHIEQADPLVTFNGKEFDIPCLEGASGFQICPRSHVDLLQVIWAALPTKKKGFGLGKVCERTLGQSKRGAGAHAPQLWNEGRYAELYTYCAHDVSLTYALYLHILEEGFIIDPDGEKLHLTV